MTRVGSTSMMMQQSPMRASSDTSQGHQQQQHQHSQQPQLSILASPACSPRGNAERSDGGSGGGGGLLLSARSSGRDADGVDVSLAPYASPAGLDEHEHDHDHDHEHDAHHPPLLEKTAPNDGGGAHNGATPPSASTAAVNSVLSSLDKLKVGGLSPAMPPAHHHLGHSTLTKTEETHSARADSDSPFDQQMKHESASAPLSAQVAPAPPTPLHLPSPSHQHALDSQQQQHQQQQLQHQQLQHLHPQHSDDDHLQQLHHHPQHTLSCDNCDRTESRMAMLENDIRSLLGILRRHVVEGALSEEEMRLVNKYEGAQQHMAADFVPIQSPSSHAVIKKQRVVNGHGGGGGGVNTDSDHHSVVGGRDHFFNQAVHNANAAGEDHMQQHEEGELDPHTGGGGGGGGSGHHTEDEGAATASAAGSTSMYYMVTSTDAQNSVAPPPWSATLAAGGGGASGAGAGATGTPCTPGTPSNPFCKPTPLLTNLSKHPLKVSYVDIPKEYTMSKKDATATLSASERTSAVRVPIRIMGRPQNPVAGANQSDDAAAAAGQPLPPVGRVPRTDIWIVSKDICAVLHIRKGNVAKTIAHFDAGSMKASMPVLCQRSNGTASTHILTVLSIRGVAKLLNTSRSPLAPRVAAWVAEQFDELCGPEPPGSVSLFNFDGNGSPATSSSKAGGTNSPPDHSHAASHGHTTRKRKSNPVPPVHTGTPIAAVTATIVPSAAAAAASSRTAPMPSRMLGTASSYSTPSSPTPMQRSITDTRASGGASIAAGQGQQPVMGIPVSQHQMQARRASLPAGQLGSYALAQQQGGYGNSSAFPAPLYPSSHSSHHTRYSSSGGGGYGSMLSGSSAGGMGLSINATSSAPTSAYTSPFSTPPTSPRGVSMQALQSSQQQPQQQQGPMAQQAQLYYLLQQQQMLQQQQAAQRQLHAQLVAQQQQQQQVQQQQTAGMGPSPYPPPLQPLQPLQSQQQQQQQPYALHSPPPLASDAGDSLSNSASLLQEELM